jgi:hypothetical protein
MAVHVGGAVSGRVQLEREAPRKVQLEGEASGEKLPFPLMSKGGRFIIFII